jgi:hypothetical protein
MFCFVPDEFEAETGFQIRFPSDLIQTVNRCKLKRMKPGGFILLLKPN